MRALGAMAFQGLSSRSLVGCGGLGLGGACTATSCPTCLRTACSCCSMLAMRALRELGSGLTACRFTPRCRSAGTPEVPLRARLRDSGGLPGRPRGRRSFAPGWPSLPGMPTSCVIIEMRLRSACGAPQGPCPPVDACACSRLALGARFPEWFWPLGPGFLASPMRAPSIQLWLVASGCIAREEVAWLGCWLPSESVSMGWLGFSSACHSSIWSRTPCPTRYHTCFRRAGDHDSQRAFRRGASRGSSWKSA